MSDLRETMESFAAGTSTARQVVSALIPSAGTPKEKAAGELDRSAPAGPN